MNLLNMMNHKLTEWEWKSLNSHSNLADGHAHHDLIEDQIKIIHSLPKLYTEASHQLQNEIQEEFFSVFFNLAGQTSYTQLTMPLCNFACSLSIETVANYLRLKNLRAALIHPTFDNLADILKRHKIPLEPIEESDLNEPEKFIKETHSDCIFLVCPNNPTGFELTDPHFKSIVDLCKKYEKMLILDNSFRFYSNLITWDQYKILFDSKIPFIVLEDTGKTWPTLDMKIGMLLSDKSTYQVLDNISNDMLLNVSPFVFKILAAFMEIDKASGTILARHPIAQNRKILIEKLQGLPLKIENSNSTLSVAWVKLPSDWKSSEFCTWIQEQGVHLLPGGPFYWNDYTRGESFVRIALSRPMKQFSELTSALVELTLKYDKKT